MPPETSENKGHSFESFSQNFEDVRLNRCFGGKEQGTYLDVGASQPCRDNNTYAFYRNGWRGVSVDPILERYLEHKNLRPRDTVINVAVGTATDDAIFYRTEGRGGLSSLDQDRQGDLAKKDIPFEIQHVQVRTLADIQKDFFEEGDWIDFMSLDVEGAEIDVLLSADFSHSKPKILLVEASPKDTRIDEILRESGYHFVCYDEVNRWYVHHEFTEFSDIISKPINYTDNVSLAKKQASCLKNTAHPDHAWAINIAAQLLKSSAVMDPKIAANTFTEKFSEGVRESLAEENFILQAYRDILHRSPNSDEIRTAIEHPKTVKELYFDLCRCEEFKIRLGSSNS